MSNSQPPRKRRQRAKGNRQQQIVSAPNNSARAVVSMQPKFNKQNSIVIVQRELITTISDDSQGTGFKVRKRLRINPASTDTFPWLSYVGRCYESYKFRKLRFVYYPRCPTSTSGSVIMSPDYDSADSGAVTEKGLSRNIGTTEDAPWKEISCSFTPSRMNQAFKTHFCMTDERFATSKQDQKTVDCAQFFIGIDSNNQNFIWGKLWVEYEVELFNPQDPEFPLDQGGGSAEYVAGDINLSTPANRIQQNPKESQGFGDVLDTTDVGNYPTNNIGKVTRDWDGLINTNYSGTGITAIPDIEVIRAADGVTLPLQQISKVINAAATFGATQHIGDLKVGDIIKLKNSGLTASAVNIMNMFTGGIDLNDIL